MHSFLSLLSPAKLNLFLLINGRRSDGYHDLQTLFQLLDFGDEMTFEANNSGEIEISPAIEGVQTKDNLIYKAAISLKDHLNSNMEEQANQLDNNINRPRI